MKRANKQPLTDIAEELADRPRYIGTHKATPEDDARRRHELAHIARLYRRAWGLMQ